MIAIMLQACFVSTNHKSKKCLIAFIISNHIFMCKRKILASNGSKISNLLESCNSSTSMFIIIVVTIVNAFDNNQWPLD